jgi:Uma2 family endonuclease
VLEVVSRSSVRKDTQLLREAYAAGGVPEYWVINAFGPEIDLQILLRQGGSYAPAPAMDGWVQSALFDREFRLTRQHDPLGYWQYTLEARTG